MSAIIKSSAKTAADAVPFQFAEIERAAEPARAAQSRAAEIVAAAQAEAAAIRRAGQAEAGAAAQRIVEEQLAQHVDSLATALRAAVEAIAGQRAAWLAHWEHTAIHLAAAIAERIVRRELAHEPQITVALVREALELAAGSGAIQVRLHPHDYEALGPGVERMIAEAGRVAQTQVVADPQISKGGCRVDTSFGTIDEQLEAQLARIEDELS